MAISVQWPVDVTRYPITGQYLDTTPPTWSADRPHLGVDFGCPSGTTVVSATTQGKVHAVHRRGDGWGDSSFGTCVVIDVLGTPWYYLYAHLSAVLVTLDETVEPGQVIAKSGGSGKDGPNTYAPHLHVQVSESPDFPRNLDITGDPILGLRGVAPAPDPDPPVTPASPSVADLTASLNNLNTVVINLGTRVTALEKVIEAMVAAAPKG